MGDFDKPNITLTDTIFLSISEEKIVVTFNFSHGNRLFIEFLFEVTITDGMLNFLIS